MLCGDLRALIMLFVLFVMFFMFACVATCLSGMVGFGLHPQPPLTEMYTHEERDLYTYTELIPKQNYYYAGKEGEGRKGRKRLKEKKKKKRWFNKKKKKKR